MINLAWYLLGLGTIPCLLLLAYCWFLVSHLLWATKWILFEYRCVKLANIACPQYADSKCVTRAKIWKRWKSLLKNRRWDDNYNNNTIEDKAGNIYEFRGWRKPKVIRREGILNTPEEKSLPPAGSPASLPSITRDVTEEDGIKMFVD